MTLKTLLVIIASASLTQAADFRTWTSNRGTTIEAQLVKFQDGKVQLITKAPKEVMLKAADLSLADRQYLIEYAQADKALLFKGEASVPEKSYKKPKDFLKKVDDIISFGTSSLTFELYETEHFMFAVGKGVKPNGIAETAEALWHGMAFQHFEFRENWGDTKALIVLPSSNEDYLAMGAYEEQALKDIGQDKAASRSKLTWDKVSANFLTVPDSSVEKLKLKPRARIFNGKDTKKFRKSWNSFQTNLIARVLIEQQTGGVSSISGSGYFAIALGHAYYKEIQLTKKTETNLISTEYGSDIVNKSGFQDGSSWPKMLKKMVKKEKVTPELEAMLHLKDASELTPESLVTVYAFSCFMQSTQEHVASYAALIRRINTSDQVPEATEFVKLFGYESVEEFDKKWKEFILSRDFK